MKTLWEVFCFDYKKMIDEKAVPLEIVLEAFFHFCSSQAKDVDHADKLIRNYK